MFWTRPNKLVEERCPPKVDSNSSLRHKASRSLGAGFSRLSCALRRVRTQAWKVSLSTTQCQGALSMSDALRPVCTLPILCPDPPILCPDHPIPFPHPPLYLPTPPFISPLTSDCGAFLPERCDELAANEKRDGGREGESGREREREAAPRPPSQFLLAGI